MKNLIITNTTKWKKIDLLFVLFYSMGVLQAGRWKCTKFGETCICNIASCLHSSWLQCNAFYEIFIYTLSIRRVRRADFSITFPKPHNTRRCEPVRRVSGPQLPVEIVAPALDAAVAQQGTGVVGSSGEGHDCWVRRHFVKAWSVLKQPAELRPCAFV